MNMMSLVVSLTQARFLTVKREADVTGKPRLTSLSLDVVLSRGVREPAPP